LTYSVQLSLISQNFNASEYAIQTQQLFLARAYDDVLHSKAFTCVESQAKLAG
jgi:hypothetical protein